MILQKLLSPSIVRSHIYSQIKLITRKSSLSVVRMAPIFNYPAARREEIKETFFGKEVKFISIVVGESKIRSIVFVISCGNLVHSL